MVSWMLTGLRESFVPLKKGGACLLEFAGEPIHEPAQRLEKATHERKMQERVLILPEGQPAVF